MIRQLIGKAFLFFQVINLSAFARPQNHLSRQNTPDSISVHNLQNHIAFLGSDALEGRGTGTRGGEAAAKYLANEFARLKLIPIGDDSSYFQNIPMHGSRPLPNSLLAISGEGREHSLELGRDYVLYNSGAHTFVPRPVPLVFVGYGIVAPEFDYNDYQALDVEGKIVVFLSGEPVSSDANYFDGSRPTVYSIPEVKQRLAVSRGARGSITIPNPREEGERNWQYWLQQFAFEDVTLLYGVTTNPSILMTPEAAQKLFDGAPMSLEQVLATDAAGSIHSFSLKMAASFRGHFQQRDFLAANVVGMVRGSDTLLGDSYMIVSAHYDHLGIGPAINADSIYNGAFDNAVGVAAVLEIARLCAADPPKRSMVFLLTTGEEKGFLGAAYYADHPGVPLYKTVANVNVDGLAMFDTFKDVVGVGEGLSTLGDDLRQLTAGLGLHVSPIPPEFVNTESFGRSDQVVFAKAGIPAILLMEGGDYVHTAQEHGLQRMIDWGASIYHSPFDDLQQPMNFEAAKQHAGILLGFCQRLANSSSPPEWKSGAPFINARLRSIAEKR
jgi:hypothetical protein